MKPTRTPAPAPFDLLRNDVLIRWQRALRIAPPTGLGVVRRAVFFALLSWLPIVVWALLNHRLIESAGGEPLLVHYGIHVRCLVAIPLLILAEATARTQLGRIVEAFHSSGVVADAERAAFDGILQDVARLRDATLPGVAILTAVLAWTLVVPLDHRADELAWAAAADGFGFGGAWYAYVARPLFLVLLVGWLWRLALVLLLFRRLARMPLSLVPTHPDRHGGLGFVKRLPAAFFLVTLAIASVIAAHWAHEVVHHGQSLVALKLPFAAFVVLWSAILLAPLLWFAPRLAAMKRDALRDYGALVGCHHRLVHRRWILRESIPQSELLQAPELGPVADTTAIFEAVERISPLPIGKSTLLTVLIPIALPMLVVVAQRIPVREVLSKLVGVLL
jgi:hypothetical protein